MRPEQKNLMKILLIVFFFITSPKIKPKSESYSFILFTEKKGSDCLGNCSSCHLEALIMKDSGQPLRWEKTQDTYMHLKAASHPSIEQQNDRNLHAFSVKICWSLRAKLLTIFSLFLKKKTPFFCSKLMRHLNNEHVIFNVVLIFEPDINF